MENCLEYIPFSEYNFATYKGNCHGHNSFHEKSVHPTIIACLSCEIQVSCHHSASSLKNQVIENEINKVLENEISTF